MFNTKFYSQMNTTPITSIFEFFKSKFSIQLSSNELNEVNDLVLESNKEGLLRIEEGICIKQKENCIKAISTAISEYYYPGMPQGELLEIVKNVSITKAETPNITDTVRFLKIG